MRVADMKRQIGYQDLIITQCCGTCARIVRRKKHLRCGKFDFAVTEYGICRGGYEPAVKQRPYDEDTPLLVQGKTLSEGVGA